MEEPVKIADVELKPRGYQTQIENIALHQNTIIYLPTGSGKTFIAIQLIKRLQHLTTKPFSEGGQRTFFLVNTVPLVNQHKSVIEQLTPLNVKGFTSQDNVDLWKENEWNSQLEEAQVIILTSQILLDMLLHGYIHFSNINLIIFDECHIAVDNHPMRQILGFLQDVPDKNAPRIIGLTATLLNKSIKIEDLESTIKDLETTLNSKICTSDLTEEVLNCSTSPNEFVVIFEKYNPTEIDNVVLRELNNLERFLELLLPSNKPKGASKLKGYDTINAEPKTFRNLKRICNLVKRSFLDMGIFGGSISLLAAIIKLERMKIKASYENQPVIQSMITRMTKARGFLQNQMSAYQGYEQIEKFSSSKILSLLNILLEYSPNFDKNKCFKKHDNPICCIIFVKERKSSLVLSMLLNHVIKNHRKFSFLKHDFVTGFNVTPFNDTRESLYEKKKNSITLAKFNHGLLNCLISTEILEEGYDLPKCNLVIRYDEMFSFRGYIQSKGRGRHSDASYVILVSHENHAQTTQKLEEFQNILTKLDELLIGKTEDRSCPTEDEVADAFKKYYEPYRFNNATITINSSISLLNRYCSILPHDIYTIPQPIWSMKKRGTSVAMAVQMPVNCPVKISAESPFVDNIKSAKQIAALEMCKCLHKAGELDDNLLPALRSKMVFNEQNNDLLFSHWPKNNNDEVALPASINELYEKKFPQCFLRDYDQDTFYLQFIKITPLLSPTYEHNEEINELLNYPNSFGIITPNKMDKICSFPLFISSGEVLIDIETQYSEVKITDIEVLPLVRFHHMILFDVIGCNQRFVTYDPYKLYNFFLIVPTLLKPQQEKYEIDWESIYKYNHFEDYYTPTFEDRGSINVSKETYQHSVVMPWYRGPISCKYLVTDVLEDLTPNSPFPNDNYVSFADYYEDKYKLTIVGPKNQSLLRVVPIGGKMNCLVPRTATLEKYISKKKQKAMHCDNEQPGMPVYDEKLIPEFCIKYEFPGTLWLKAMLLPSIIHRITMLLIADELRQKIAVEAGIGSVHQSGDASWDQMILDNYAVQKFNLQKLREDSPEFPPNNDFEDINPDVNVGPKRSTLDVSYEVTKNKIDHNYPWKPCIEPVDIYRQPETISVMDIECYERFVNEPVTFQSCDVTTDHNTSIEPVFSKRAICAPPQKYSFFDFITPKSRLTEVIRY